METRLTPIRRFIADNQAYIVAGLILAMFAFIWIGDLSPVQVNWLVCAILILIVVIAFIAQYTARNRDKYLRIMARGINQLGGQKFVDSFFRNMLSKMSMTDISTTFDKYISQMSALMQRLGFKPSLLGK